MIVEFRQGYDFVQLSAQELMKLMEFVIELDPRNITKRVRDEFKKIIVETSDQKITQLCLDYDPNEKEET
jgi:hypothetical protein